MRIMLAFLLAIILFSAAYAISDIGLIDSPKTFGYYLMPATDFARYSSGLVYNQKLTTTEDLEIIYTSFNSAFLITSNITQLGVHKKFKWHFGGLGLTALAGLGGIYSPAVGGGLIGDIGGDIYFKPVDNLAVALPLYVFIFNDGSRIDITPSFYVKPPFFDKHEIFGGYRFIVSTVGSGTSTGTTNSYFVVGLRCGLQ